MQNLNESYAQLLGLNKDLLKLMMTIERRPSTKAGLVRKGFAPHQVDGLLNRHLARANRVGLIQLGGAGEALLNVVFSGSSGPKLVERSKRQ